MGGNDHPRPVAVTCSRVLEVMLPSFALAYFCCHWQRCRNACSCCLLIDGAAVNDVDEGGGAGGDDDGGGGGGS